MGNCFVRIDTMGSIHRNLDVGLEETWVGKFRPGFFTEVSSKRSVGHSTWNGESTVVGGPRDSATPMVVSIVV